MRFPALEATNSMSRLLENNRHCPLRRQRVERQKLRFEEHELTAIQVPFYRQPGREPALLWGEFKNLQTTEENIN
jgi:hypothetical protein